MKLRLSLYIGILLFSCSLFAQENFLLNGKVISKNKALNNVHIVNTSSSLGSITNDLGFFSLLVKAGDTLLISSLAHQRLRMKITDDIVSEKYLVIELQPNVVALDEMKLTGLTGNLEYDLERKPSDTIPQIGWKFSTRDLKVKLPTDDLMNQSNVNAEAFVNPIQGGGAGIGLPDKALIREQRLKRELKLKKEFSNKLIKEFGISYFTVTLGISKEKIPNFITFCEPFDLFKKYQSNQILEVIEILKKESTLYNELENEQD